MTGADDIDPPVEAVLFDLDHTLVEYAQDRDAVLTAAFERAGVDPFCSWPEVLAAAEDAPDRSHAEVWTAAFRRAAEHHGGDPDAARALYDAYGTEFDRTQVRFREGADRVLRTARDRFQVGVVTNGTREVQARKLDRLGLTGAFETVVCSSDVPEPKPATAPFEAALNDLDAPARRALYVGDAPRYDVAGAHAAGLQAVLWPPETPEGTTADGHSATDGPGSRPSPDVRADSADDLVALLETVAAEREVSR